MFKVQYREIKTDLEDQEYYQDWVTWNQLGEFQTLYLASRAVLKVAYKNKAGHFVHVSSKPKGLPIYEAAIKPREYQFRFPQTQYDIITHDEGVPVIKESPWKIGLNDV